MESALELLADEFNHIRSSDPLPIFDPLAPEAAARVLVGIGLAGDYTAYGVAHATVRCVDALCGAAGVARVADLTVVDEAHLQRLVWTHGACIPDITTRECVALIFRIAGVLQRLGGDPLAVDHRDLQGTRDLLADVMPEAMPGLFACEVMGVPELRVKPSGGATNLLCAVGLVEWQTELLSGFDGLRIEAMLCLEELPRDYALAAEWWGKHCPDHCDLCPAGGCCQGVKSGLIDWVRHGQ